MSALTWGGAAAVIVLWALWGRFSPSIEKLVRQSAKSGDLDPVLAALTNKRPAAQPTAFNLAIRMLWDVQQRELALELVKELAMPWCPDSRPN